MTYADPAPASASASTPTPTPTPPADNMKINPARATALATAYGDIATRVSKVASGRNVRLVAVSKLKPATDILALHESRHDVVHFGENYAQELMEKAERLPRGIRWHFIGGLQSNKCKSLASSVPNLFCVSSVDSIKKATQLDHGRAQLLSSPTTTTTSSPTEKLNIHIQINTSSEPSKSGVVAGSADALALTRHVLTSCPHLHLLGFMTIGAIARSTATTASSSPNDENEDFTCLRAERDRLAEAVGRDKGEEEWELSMGMSADFEAAIRAGSNEVRVGSEIFGARERKEEKEVVEGVREGKS